MTEEKFELPDMKKRNTKASVMTKCSQAEKSENNQIKNGIHPFLAYFLPYEWSTRINNREHSVLTHLHAITQHALWVYHFGEEVC